MYEESFSHLPSVDNEHQINLDRYKKFISSRPIRKYKSKSGLCRHHIWPTAFGANKSYYIQKWNIIVLTEREHYIAHMILYYCKYSEMIYAFRLMALLDENNKLTSKQYERLVLEYSKISSKNMTGENNPLFGKTKEETPFYGHHHTEETKKFLSDTKKEYFATHDGTRLGSIVSKETKQKLSIKAKERYKNPENNPMFGKHQSDEVKEKISKANIGKTSAFKGKHHSEKAKEELRQGQLKNSAKRKKVINIDTNKVFNSLIEAGKFYSIFSQNISACCKGKQKTAGGFHWKYID